MIKEFQARLKLKDYYTVRTKFFALASMLANLGMGFIKTVLSVFQLSLYLGLNGIYNMTLGTAKMRALKAHKRMSREHDPAIRAEIERACLIKMSNKTVMISVLYLCFGVISAFFFDDKANYGISVVFLIAVTAFIKLVMNAAGSRRLKNSKDEIIRYIKLVNVADCLVSIALTQRAIMHMVGISRAGFYSGIGEIVFSILALAVSLYMAVRARTVYKHRQNEAKPAIAEVIAPEVEEGGIT